MKNQTSPIPTQQGYRIPKLMWMIAAGLILAFVAVFVFNVSWSTVGYAGLIVLLVGSHFWIHGSHGGHSSHAGHQHQQNMSAGVDGPAVAEQNQTHGEHGGHSGCC